MKQTDPEYPPIPAVHLAIRFLLELAMLAGVCLAGWELGGVAGAISAPLAAAALWGVFGTQGDGSRGDPVVPVSGRVRLLLEIVLFGIATYGYWAGWTRAASETFLTISVLHYGITWERQAWLVRTKLPSPHPKTR